MDCRWKEPHHPWQAQFPYAGNRASSCLNQGANPPPASYTNSAQHYYFQNITMATGLIDRLVLEYCLGDVESIARHGTFFYRALSGSIAF